MQLFRKRFLYNPESPIFQSGNVKTFNCMNTQTKDNKLLLLMHLKEPPFVDSSPNILQPIELPTVSEPYSVYPMVNCCSQIGKIAQADAMYILKCLLEAKIQNPLYYVLSPQGVCVSEVEGLLPSKSPKLFQIAIQMLDIPPSLQQTDKSVISKDGYEICRGLKNEQKVIEMVNKYGWKQSKKEKNVIKDNDFWIFKGRRKEESPFSQQYGLAWSGKFALSRFRYIDLSKDGYEEQFYNDFAQKIQFIKAESGNKKYNLLEIFKYQKDAKGIKIFTEIASQGPFGQFIMTKHNRGKTLTQKSALSLLDNFVSMMRNIKQNQKVNAFGMLHLKNLYVQNNKITIGEPFLVTDKIQKKLRQLKNGMDYFAPQLKENIYIPDNLFKLDFEKMDIWFFGFLLHKIFVREIPIFDSTRKPILSKDKLSPGMYDLINRCLSLTPGNRPSWNDINLKELDKFILIEEVQSKNQDKQIIKLGTRRQVASRAKQQIVRQSNIHSEKQSIQKSQIKPKYDFDEQNKFLKQQEVKEKQVQVPQFQSHPKFRKTKMILKVIFVLILYIFVFFRPFLGNSIDILLVRSYYATSSLHLTDSSGNSLSTVTIITSQPVFFMQNDITFQDLYNKYYCIDNTFNPINDPSYSLITYVQSNSFLGFMLSGWLIFLLICGTKVISMWKGGVSNKSNRNVQKYWLTYGFHQLSLAALLFAHFYIFQFFYFSTSDPCFGINNYSEIQPLFDSSLYLFLGNDNQYMAKVFATLGILSIFIFLSSCLYAWSYKIDMKNIFSIPSVILRFIPYILLILICRIGVFMVISPTAINDETQIIPSLIQGSFIGFIGIIPEVFIAIVVIFQFLFQIFMEWIQKKIMQYGKLARFLGLKKGGKGTQNLSKLSKINDSLQKSLQQSKHKLMIQDAY